MPKRSSSKPGVVGPSDVGESFASLVGQSDEDGQGEQRESFASLVKRPRAKTNRPKRAKTNSRAKTDGDANPMAAKKKKRGRTGAGATTRKRAATNRSVDARPTPAPPQRYNTTVAVFENGASNQKRAVDVALALGYSAQDTRRDAGKLRELLTTEPTSSLLLVGMPGGEEVIEQARELSPQTLLIASMPGPAESARKRAVELGSDLFVVRPHTKDSLAVVLLAAEELAKARAEANRLRKSEIQLRERLQNAGASANPTGFPQFDFFERVLIMEIKRAKRFGYSLATALVAFDQAGTAPSSGTDQLAGSRNDTSHLEDDEAQALRDRVAKAIRANIRDIDLPVEYSDGRILLFLPYTDLEGATEVGRRVAAAVRQFGHLDTADHRISCSVSIGISAIRPGNPISFARLMKDAQQALRAAQLKGGDRVVVRK